jgi:hypothetical protein
MIRENVYSIRSIGFISVLLLGWYICSYLRYRARFAKLGAEPRLVPYYLPFGIDTIWVTLKVRPQMIR